MNNYVNAITIKNIQEIQKKVNPFSFINELCDRLDHIEPIIKSFIPEENRRSRLLKDVKNLVDKYPDIKNRPPLFCVPVGIKDIFIVEGFTTSAGSKLPPKLFVGKESSFVTKLKNAGAIIIGKTVTTEFAYFEPGPTTNPHNISHTPGGSSSGSAAAVAAGLCSIASGTQTIGSISRPASYCGVVGFKPSYARIPTDGIIPFSPSLDHAGFFANNVEDIATVANISCLDWDEKKTKKHSNKLPTIAIITEGDYLLQAKKEIITFFNNCINFLKDKGFNIITINPFPDIKNINTMHKKLAAAEMAKVHANWYKKYKHLYSQKTIELIEEGLKISPEDIAKALEGRFLLKKRIETIIEANNIDVILSPSTTDYAPQGLSSTGSPLMNLPWTYSGLPTISLPISKSDKGLPCGIQITGQFQKDELLIMHSKLLEKIFDQK
ncbi:MAG TPA: amidase [Bacteroidales bacterium]|nr:amidase [Bacteroidales bacterium]